MDNGLYSRGSKNGKNKASYVERKQVLMRSHTQSKVGYNTVKSDGRSNCPRETEHDRYSRKEMNNKNLNRRMEGKSKKYDQPFESHRPKVEECSRRVSMLLKK